MYTSEKTFEKLDFTEMPLDKGEYEACSFTNCNFSGVDLSHITFSESVFVGCNLSMAKIYKSTGFKTVKFKQCKLVGLHFQHANEFLLAFEFESCQLKLASFYQLKLKNTLFKNCSLEEVDFSESDLTQAVFENSDLTKAIFENTILEKTDFRTAYNYTIDLEINKAKKTKFSSAGLLGLLSKYDIVVD